jgi:hypothetical protein
MVRGYRSQMSKARTPSLIGIFPLAVVERGGRLLLYCGGGLKVLVIPTAMAELLSCKLLSTLAAGKYTVNDTVCWISSMGPISKLRIMEYSRMPLSGT